MSTTPEGVQQALTVNQNVSTESTFQGLFDKGAFEPSKNAPAPVDRYVGSDQADRPAPKQAKREPAPKADKVAPDTAEKVAVPEAQKADGEELQAASEAETPIEGEEGAEAAESEAKTYSSLEAFAKEHDIDYESLQELGVTVQIDGETKTVPLKQAIKNFQLEGHVNNKSIMLSDQRREFETEQTNIRQAIVAQINNAQALYQDAEQQLMGEYQNVNWVALRAQDPAEFAAKATEYQQKLASVQQGLQRVHLARQAEEQRQQQEVAKLLPQRREKMLELIPEWKDPKTFESGRNDILTYGKQLGFSDAELGNIIDHRHMKILHDAARYAQLQAQKPESLKKVRAAPQMAKPGARSERDPKVAARTQAQQRFQANPRSQDAQAAYFDTLTG